MEAEATLSLLRGWTPRPRLGGTVATWRGDREHAATRSHPAPPWTQPPGADQSDTWPLLGETHKNEGSARPHHLRDKFSS